MNFRVLDFLQEEQESIKIDRAFQRKACWTLQQKRNFIKSSLLGRAPYPIVLADVKTGLRYSIKRNRTASVNAYKKAQDEGCDFISLDGQNRVAALSSFFNNEYTISGKFLCKDGQWHNIDNQFYKDLPPRLKDAFDDMTLEVAKMKHCLYSDLHKIFVDINDGQSLNNQEKRNAIMTTFSGYIRNFSETEDSQKLIGRIIGITEVMISRSLDAEWFAKTYMSILRPNRHHLTASGLDKFYSQGEGRPQSAIEDYSEQNQERFENIMQMVHQAVFCRSVRGTPVSQRLFWALTIAASNFYDTGKTIKSYSDFFDSVKAVDSMLCAQADLDYGEAFKKWSADPNALDEDEPKKSRYYSHWASDVNSPTVRIKRREALLKALVEDETYGSYIDLGEELVAK